VKDENYQMGWALRCRIIGVGYSFILGDGKWHRACNTNDHTVVFLSSTYGDTFIIYDIIEIE
jgi:hypothetical protein